VCYLLNPSIVKSKSTVKKLNPGAEFFSPDANSIPRPNFFKYDNNEPSPSCPIKCDRYDSGLMKWRHASRYED